MGTNKNYARETQTIDLKSNLTLEPHVCRSCFGRVTSTKLSDGQKHYQCTNCGLSAVGLKPSVVCACGMKLRKARGDGRSSFVMVDAGIRCHENNHRSPEFPALFVASFAGI